MPTVTGEITNEQVLAVSAAGVLIGMRATCKVLGERGLPNDLFYAMRELDEHIARVHALAVAEAGPAAVRGIAPRG